MSTTKHDLRRTIAATLALAAAGLLTAPLHAQFGISVSIGATSTVPPPPLPEYDQPEAPGDGYLWTPGYWAWDDQVGDYYWVPGTWVLAPQPGLLWTPGYWAYENGYYGFHNGYWGEHVGFYGGVNYGFGYFGTGYEGGYWNGDRFFYNTAINRINVTFVHNTYIRPMRPEWNVRGPRFAFNGPGGINVRPGRGEEMAFRERHVEPTGFQRNQQNFARQDRSQFAGFNHGAPPAAATPRPVQNVGGFRQGAAPAHGAPAAADGFNRGGGFNGNNRPGGNNGSDNRGNGGGQFNGNSGQFNGNGGGQFNGNNRGNMTQSAGPQNSGANGSAGRTGVPQGAAPVQPAQQSSGQGSSFRPGDGSFRPQPANPPRMPAPQENNNRFNNGQGGQQPGQTQQPRSFQQQQPAAQQQPAGQQPAQQRQFQQQPAQQPMQQRQFQQQPAQPMQRQFQQQPAQQRPQQPVQQQRPAQAQPQPQQRSEPAHTSGERERR